MPAQLSPMSGPSDVRPREGLSPTSPHSLAGIRIEPPPSFACATATIRAATADADPPLAPPGQRVRSPGFLVGPYASRSLVALSPSSAVLVFPSVMHPPAV